MKALSKKDVRTVSIVAKAVRHSILSMTAEAGSGHPGGSLSCADFLSLLYTNIISKEGNPVVISNGHISPAVYAVLAEMGYVSKKDLLKTFRKDGSLFEGHVSREVPGVWYGTGPLGTGAGAASGMALASKIKKEKQTVYCLVGDGECQEGQIYEMMHVAVKYELENLVLFMDYNQVQLSGSLQTVMPYDPVAHFEAAGWHVQLVDGHDIIDLWKALGAAQKKKGKPSIIIGKTIMGKGSQLMEKAGRARQSTWHGSAPSSKEIESDLEALRLTPEEEDILAHFRSQISWKPDRPHVIKPLKKESLPTGKVRLYKAGELVDCRTAYGKALLDLGKKHSHIVALTADLAGSVRTSYLAKERPNQHFDVGIGEQEMISAAGGMSLSGMIPFASTFGVFMTSRAKDQARVNDINHTNVKMVATHCGLSVGEDGPTHQAIDDAGSMLGLLHTAHIEPADANHCDRIIRYAASHHGNMYIRMGRHALPILTTSAGKPFFSAAYKYVYGKCDLYRKGKDITIAAIGSTVAEAAAAHELLLEEGIEAEIIICSSIKHFSSTLFSSIKKNGRLITVEDHTTRSGLGSQIVLQLVEKEIRPAAFQMLGVDVYQRSGTHSQLYTRAGIDAAAIAKQAKKMCV